MAILVSSFEEWRVFGEPGEGYPPYDFIWTCGGDWGRGQQSDDPQRDARAFFRLLTQPGRKRWKSGPWLYRRVVTVEVEAWHPMGGS